MLITNFAAGELSKTLFGRIDLSQYYRGAAKMENFDIIPTGGVKRRTGMERMKLLDGEGRLVPFIVNRDLSFLLYLEPGKITGKITAYKLENGEPAGTPTVFTSNENRRLYENLGHIRDVQYAQNYDTMILCHEDYPPLEVTLQNGSLEVSTLRMNFDVMVVAVSENITEQDKPDDEDEQYEQNGWLVSDGNYPAAVAFYNGRLVFAGTKNEQQRVFASAIKKSGEPYNFATYKTHLTENKEYLTVYAKSVAQGEIQIETPEIAIKFVRPINEYYVDSPNFPKGTRVWRLEGDTMKLTSDISGAFFEKTRIENEMIPNNDAYKAAEEKETVATKSLYRNVKQLGRVAWDTTVDNGTSLYSWNSEKIYEIRYGANHIQFVVRFRERRQGSSWPDWSYAVYYEKNLDDDIASKSDDSIKQEIRAALEDGEQRLSNDYAQYANYVQYGEDKYHNQLTSVVKNYSFAQKEEIVNAMFTTITSTMKYLLHSEDNQYEKWFFKIPADYMSAILPFVEATKNIYVSFYTRDVTSTQQPHPDCGFTFEIASGASDAIRWLAVNKGLIIGTEMGEFIVPPDVHATNVYAANNSRYGSDRIQGAAVGDATIFFQTGKKSLVEYYIPQQDSNFRANNMAMLCPEMLSESPAVEFDFMTAPYTKLLITREDGTVATLLYERGTGTFAWSRMTTKGEVKSIAVLPGSDGNDDIFLIVRREKGCFLERLRENGEIYMDCWQPVSQETWEEARAEYPADGTYLDFVKRKGGDANIKETAMFYLKRKHQDIFPHEHRRAVAEVENSIKEIWGYRSKTDAQWKGEFVEDYANWRQSGMAQEPEMEAVFAAFEDVHRLKKYFEAAEPSDGQAKRHHLFAGEEPDWTQGAEWSIGCTYKSTLRTMPVIYNEGMEAKDRIVSLVFRFLNSYFPALENPLGRFSGNEPYTGIKEVSSPGEWETDPYAEFFTDAVEPVTVLALEAIMDKKA